MKIELALFKTTDTFWEGLVRIEGEIYKATLFPPRPGKNDWEGVVYQGGFVTLDEGKVMYEAIKKGWEEFTKLRQSLTEFDLSFLTQEERETINHLLSDDEKKEE